MGVQSKVGLGRWGEKVACFWLKKQGYQIVSTNYRSKWGEIDIVALRGNRLLFVEVKTRTSNKFGGAERAVRLRKWSSKKRQARKFLASLPNAERFEAVLGLLYVKRFGKKVYVGLRYLGC